MITLIFAALLFFPLITASLLVATLTLLYLASFVFKTVLFLANPAHDAAAPDVPRQNDDILPVYTVLVPLYREAQALPVLLSGLFQLDYPRDKLDVKFILEADDQETQDALAAHFVPDWIEIIRVPFTRPRTKPKALNYGLSFARGSYVVVYDAEDQPEPDQLLRALARFAECGPNTACLQARLNVYNVEENWICRLFAVDYCLWFDHLLPGLERFGAPLPLGGTSNHFRREALVAAGGWDAFNVTEDADLGFRLGREGYRVRTLDSTTFEEAPTTIRAWLTQRARWIKGYLQTYLVHTRNRRQLRREIGLTGVLALELFLMGTAMAGLANPLLWMLFAMWLVTGQGVMGGLTGTALFVASLLGLVGGNALLLYLSLLAPLRRGWLRLVPYALTAPLYWLLLSVAAWRGLFSLVFRPFHWAKTEHGLTRFEARPGISRLRQTG